MSKKGKNFPNISERGADKDCVSHGVTEFESVSEVSMSRTKVYVVTDDYSVFERTRSFYQGQDVQVEYFTPGQWEPGRTVQICPNLPINLVII